MQRNKFIRNPSRPKRDFCSDCGIVSSILVSGKCVNCRIPPLGRPSTDNDYDTVEYARGYAESMEHNFRTMGRA